MLSMMLTQPISTPLQSGICFLPHLLSAPLSVHLAMNFPLAGSDVELPLFRGNDKIGLFYAPTVLFTLTENPEASVLTAKRASQHIY
jgi:hypothetical protein